MPIITAWTAVNPKPMTMRPVKFICNAMVRLWKTVGVVSTCIVGWGRGDLRSGKYVVKSRDSMERELTYPTH